MFRPNAPWRVTVLLCCALSATVAFAKAPTPVNVTVVEDTSVHTVLHYEIGDYTMEGVQIDGQKYNQIRLGHESLMKTAGAPALPNVCRSVIIPDDAGMDVQIISAEYTEITGVDIAPSKGVIYRDTNPADVPFSFGKEYATDAFFPGEIATLRDPYIMRDYRGVVVELNPFQYNPVTHTLRVYSDITVEIVATGPGHINVLQDAPSQICVAFNNLYAGHFLNYGSRTRYTPLDEQGDMLIIVYDDWAANVQPLADHRTARGIATTVVPVSTIGNSSVAIANYIQGVYDSSDLAFVLLVGDADEVATPYASGGSSDPTYAKVAGSDDYPDIMVGRFSAETSDQVDTQVERTIEYESMPATSQEWFWRGTGVASDQGVGDDNEYDDEHIDNIRADLLAYGYTHVDQIYDPSGTAAQVSTALNAGRGIINYCGHGSTTSWSSTGFSNTNVDALTNDNMLPFICSVACVNGQFDGYTCFGEAWLRATHNGEPTGAISAYMSSVNQSWDPPMCAQDEVVDRFVAEDYMCVGTLFYAGSCQMIDEYAADGVEMFDTWHVFGDPAVHVVMSCTDAGVVSIDNDKYACEDTVMIQVVDCGLDLDSGVADTADVLVMSDTEPAGEIVTLTELGTDTGQFEGSITIGTTGVLPVSADDTITVQYTDADDGMGGTNVLVTATAVVDCTPPTVTSVYVTDIEPRSATVNIEADEVVHGIVYYGLACDDLPYDTTGGFGDPATVALSGLQDSTTYYFKMLVEDEAGNYVLVGDAGGCFTFTTPDVPDFFAEQFESGFDLDSTSLLFTPTGSVDFYQGCAEAIMDLPTDPSSGTTITLSDDDSHTINLTDNQVVSLYGQTYSTVYVSSNGYITLDSAETDYDETLEEHFSHAAVAGLYDDLNPSSGGAVSYEQLADRLVVSYVNVPEYNTTNSNTFQIELYFNGDIRISYLEIAVEDGIAGLSEGVGLDPDYYPSDLSALGSCGPRPPTAFSGSASTPANAAVNIFLNCADDGLPEPAALSLVIDTLPAHGSLSDPGAGAGAIDTVPYTLVANGEEVVYTPDAWYMGADQFEFHANDSGIAPEGGDSNTAIVDITVEIPDAEMVYEYTFDTDPGWTQDGFWHFSEPRGGGSHNYDPTAAYTGTNVLGYNMFGDYANNMGEPIYVTTTAIDCTDLLQVEVRFWRWLGVERAPYDNATLEASTNGTDWTEIWHNPENGSIADTEWVQCVYDISAVADDQATVYLRWGMGSTDDTTTYPGWNIDDVEIWGVVTGSALFGDLNGDCIVDLSDLQILLSNYGQSADANGGDLDGSGTVDLSDLQQLLSVYGDAC